jgi:hypothetical protein
MFIDQGLTAEIGRGDCYPLKHYPTILAGTDPCLYQRSGAPTFSDLSGQAKPFSRGIMYIHCRSGSARTSPSLPGAGCDERGDDARQNASFAA